MRALSIVLRLAAAENGGGCVRTTCRGLLALAALQSLPVTRRLLSALVSCPKKICSRIAKFYEHNIQTHSNQNLRVIPKRIQGRGRRWTASEEEEQAKQRAGCGRCPLLGGKTRSAAGGERGAEEGQGECGDDGEHAYTKSRCGSEGRGGCDAGGGGTSRPPLQLAHRRFHSTARFRLYNHGGRRGGGPRAAAFFSEPKVGVRSKAQRRSAITPPSALGAEGSRNQRRCCRLQP